MRTSPFLVALRQDLRELAACTVTCVVHGGVAAGILLALAVPWSAAASTAMLLGGVKLFQVSDDRKYLRRTRAHVRKQR